MTAKTAQRRRMTVKELVGTAYGDLSPGHRRVADFILANAHEAAFMTVHALAVATGTSASTADRLAKRLGLRGHRELRAALHAELKRSLRPVDDLVETLVADAASGDTPWLRSLREDIAEIQSLAGATASFEDAALRLARARRVFCVGFGSSAFLAQYAAFCFASLRPQVQAVNDAGGLEMAFRHVTDARPDDLVVQLAYPRYTAHNVDVARHCRRRKVPIVLITDEPRSPLVEFATTSFYTQHKPGWLATGSGTAAVAVIEALLRAMAAHMDRKATSRRTAVLTESLADAVIEPAGSGTKPR